MNWIITETNNLPLILCGIFYSILAIFSIITGLMYVLSKRKLNSIDLPDKLIKKLNTKEKLTKFTFKIGWITLIFGIFQVIAALSIFKGYNVILWWIVTCFTIFSIILESFKLKSKTNKFSIIRLIIYIVILFILIISGARNYPASSEVQGYLISSKSVKVSKINEGYFFDGPGTKTAIIFFPGARVEYKSYSKLMYKIAETGQDTFLLAMPLNLAFLGINTSDKIIKEYDYENWYLSGHSLGGVAACSYASNNPKKIKGIINLASYSSTKIPTNIEYISIYGSEDKVLNLEEYQKAKKYLPKSSSEYIIEGGNHSGFANYGNQKNDGVALITSAEQQEYAISIINQIIKK